jgi:hypothetical protein
MVRLALIAAFAAALLGCGGGTPVAPAPAAEVAEARSEACAGIALLDGPAALRVSRRAGKPEVALADVLDPGSAAPEALVYEARLRRARLRVAQGRVDDARTELRGLVDRQAGERRVGIQEEPVAGPSRADPRKAACFLAVAAESCLNSLTRHQGECSDARSIALYANALPDAHGAGADPLGARA